MAEVYYMFSLFIKCFNAVINTLHCFVRSRGASLGAVFVDPGEIVAGYETVRVAILEEMR